MMKKATIYFSVMGFVTAITSTAWAGADGRIDSFELQSPTFNVRVDDLTGGAGTNFQGSLFYLNDSVTSNGNLLAGQIGWGVWEIDKTGNAVNFLQTNTTLGLSGQAIGSPPIGAKSAVIIGDQVYLGANNHGGIARFDATGADAWSTASLSGLTELLPTTGPQGNRHHIESIATNATTAPTLLDAFLFTNESQFGEDRGAVHAYSVREQGNSGNFTFDEEWVTDVNDEPDVVNANPRFRGLAYGNNGFVYGVDTGDGGAGSVWAFDVTDGTATKVVDYVDPAGTGNSFLGESIMLPEPISGFGVIVRQAQDENDVPVDELIIVGSGGFLSTFELTTPTSADPNSQEDFDIADELNLDQGVDVALYGAALDGGRTDPDHFLWLSFETSDEQNNRRVAGFAIINPEPSSLAIFAVGTMWLVGRRRSKRAAA